MLCFKDKSFCAARTCLNYGCGRNFSPSMQYEAKQWWGSDDAPVAFYPFRGTKECPGYVGPDEEL